MNCAEMKAEIKRLTVERNRIIMEWKTLKKIEDELFRLEVKLRNFKLTDILDQPLGIGDIVLINGNHCWLKREIVEISLENETLVLVNPEYNYDINPKRFSPKDVIKL